MLKITGTEIYLTRGDSALFQISATVDGTSPAEPYTFQVGDKLKFAVKKKATDSATLVSKEVTVATAGTTVNIQLDPNDTKNIPFGSYFYDVQLTKVNGWIDTIITKSKFKVGEEIG